MRFLEKVGRNIDDAVVEALIELGATRDEVTIEVLDKGSKGFLGIGAKPSKVRVTVNEEVETTNDLERSILEEEIKITDKDSLLSNIETEPTHKSNQKDEPIKQTQKPVDKLEQAAQTGVLFLKDVLKEMGVDGDVSIEIKQDQVHMNITGTKMGMVIGKRGETLDALQYLTNIVVNKANEQYVKVIIDTENYRKRREETLKKVALKFAKKATELKKPVALEPMNPYDRRIIHSVLQNSKTVKTHSEGREPFRKVVISPVQHNRNYKR